MSRTALVDAMIASDGVLRQNRVRLAWRGSVGYRRTEHAYDRRADGPPLYRRAVGMLRRSGPAQKDVIVRAGRI